MPRLDYHDAEKVSDTIKTVAFEAGERGGNDDEIEILQNIAEDAVGMLSPSQRRTLLANARKDAREHRVNNS